MGEMDNWLIEKLDKRIEELEAELTKLHEQNRKDALAGQAALDEANNTITKLEAELAELQEWTNQLETEKDNHDEHIAGMQKVIDDFSNQTDPEKYWRNKLFDIVFKMTGIEQKNEKLESVLADAKRWREIKPLIDKLVEVMK